MNTCKICHSKTELIMDFGRMPIANGFIKKITDKEYFFNLSLVFCPKCLMVQLGETVKPEMMFNDHYQFISGTSTVMAKHFKEIANEIKQIVKKVKQPFIVELGCNDGIMLKHLWKFLHLGVEPSYNVAQMARDNGLDIWESFFNKTVSEEIVVYYKQADVINGSNVFCHIEDINSVFEGIKVLLKPDGVCFFEEPYIYDIIKKSSFDQIYDEHVYYYSGLSINNLAKRHGLKLVDMKHLDTHGGSMRYYLKFKGKQSNRVKKYIKLEKQMKLHKFSGYKNFKRKVDVICKNLKYMLTTLKHATCYFDGYPLVGYGATSKSTTLLNYAKIGTDLVDYICDTTPTKIGMFTPGMHIPVKSHSQFVKDKHPVDGCEPPYILLLAWNHKKEIMEKERNYRGKFITYFPKVRIN